MLIRDENYSRQNGLTRQIANPEKITAAKRAADLILGRENLAIRFIGYSQGSMNV
jgi:hypothetical protein